MSETRTQVEALIADVLGIDQPIDWSEVLYQETPEWDSLVHMAIITELESTFDMTFTPDEIMSMTSLDEILALLGGKCIATP